MFKAFTASSVQGPAGRLHALCGGQGAPLLLLHGHPQSHFMWHAVAENLARSFTVVLMDLRGYGDATIDLVHDRADVASGARLAQPLRVLRGEHGVVGKCFDVLELWRERASNVSGLSLPCGHYIAEEAPALLMDEASHFFEN